MPERLGSILRRIDSLSLACGRLGAGLFFVLMLAMVYEVVMRYAFGAPTMWAYEVSTLLMGAGYALAVAMALQQQVHVRVDILTSALSPRVRALIDLVGYAVFLLPILVWANWVLLDYFLGAYASGERTGQSAWNPPIWPLRLVLVVGFLLFALQVLSELVRSAARVLRPEPPAPPPV